MRAARHWGRIVLILGLAVAHSGCRPEREIVASPIGEPPPPNVVATVGEVEIRREELEQEVERQRARGLRVEPAAVLQEMIQRESLVALAREAGLDQAPDVVRAMKNLLVGALKDRELAQLEATAKGSGMGPEAREMIEVRQARLAVLRQRVPPLADTNRWREARARLEQVRARAAELPEAGKGFGDFAQVASDDKATALQGGDLGWVDEKPARTRHDPVIFEVAAGLRAEGDVSAVVQGRDGWYLVRLIDRRTTERRMVAADDFAAASGAELRAAAERALEERARDRFPARILQPPAALLPEGERSEPESLRTVSLP